MVERYIINPSFLRLHVKVALHATLPDGQMHCSHSAERAILKQLDCACSSQSQEAAHEGHFSHDMASPSLRELLRICPDRGASIGELANLAGNRLAQLETYNQPSLCLMHRSYPKPARVQALFLPF